MKLEFRTKNTAYGMAHYLCIDTNAKTFPASLMAGYPRTCLL